MFTLQAASAVSALDSISDADKATLQQLLGDCSQPLEHRAPVTIEGNSSDTPPPINITEFLSNITNEISNHTDEYYALLTVQNFSSTIEGDTIYNGFTGYLPGTTFVERLVTDKVNANTIEITDIVMTGYTFEDKDVVTDVTFSFDPDTCEGTLSVTKETVRVLVAV